MLLPWYLYKKYGDMQLLEKHYGLDVYKRQFLGFSSVTHYQFVHITDIDRDYEDILADVEKEWEEIGREHKSAVCLEGQRGRTPISSNFFLFDIRQIPGCNHECRFHAD